MKRRDYRSNTQAQVTTGHKNFIDLTQPNAKLSPTLGNSYNTYPLDRTISLKLPFNSALSCLVILEVGT